MKKKPIYLICSSDGTKLTEFLSTSCNTKKHCREKGLPSAYAFNKTGRIVSAARQTEDGVYNVSYPKKFVSEAAAALWKELNEKA